MTTFNDREKGFEAKFSHDQDLQFRVRMRRNKLAGQWAAELLGLEGEGAESYAKACCEADFEVPGDQDVIDKLRGDLAAKGIDRSDHLLQAELDRLMIVAKEQIAAEED